MFHSLVRPELKTPGYETTPSEPGFFAHATSQKAPFTGRRFSPQVHLRVSWFPESSTSRNLRARVARWGGCSMVL